MKSSQLLTALSFLGIIVLILGGVWLFQLFSSQSSTTTGTEEEGVFSSLFPFGRSDTTSSSDTPDTTQNLGGPLQRLRQVSDAPVGGATFVTSIAGAPALRYAERETGHIYEMPLDSLTSVRLTNTTITGVHDAYWLTASTTIYRLSSGDSLENFSGTITATSTDSPLSGAFLSPYTRVAVADGTTLGVLEENGSTLETVGNDGTRKTVLISPLTSWVPHTANSKLYVASAPSGRTLGALYEITNGALTKVVGNLPGLQAQFGPSGVLVSTGGVNTVQLFVVQDGLLFTLPRATLAEKCAWVDTRVLCAIPETLPGGLYPDDWLLGRVRTEDRLWFIDTLTNVATEVVNPADENVPAMDILKVTVSEDGQYASFVNKNDQTLWLVNLRAQE